MSGSGIQRASAGHKAAVAVAIIRHLSARARPGQPVKLDVSHKPQCGGVRTTVSRWRCAVGWIVYLLVAVAVVVLVGTAHR